MWVNYCVVVVTFFHLFHTTNKLTASVLHVLHDSGLDWMCHDDIADIAVGHKGCGHGGNAQTVRVRGPWGGVEA